ncbi:MAG: MerR family DNA-binding transcriptional regulator [Hyphomicrobiaceae bacterium]
MTDAQKSGPSPKTRMGTARQANAPEETEPKEGHGVTAIGDLARTFGISTRAIRFYEARGLLSPARRGSARIYGPGDRHRLELIVRAKNLGLTLEEIGEHLAIYDAVTAPPVDAESLRARMARHVSMLVAKRNDIQATLKDMRAIRARLTAARPKAPFHRS